MSALNFNDYAVLDGSPSTFADAGPEETITLQTPDHVDVTLSGGVFLSSETNNLVDQSTVYATAGNAQSYGVNADPSLKNPITLTFPAPIEDIALNVESGLPEPVTYLIADNVGHSVAVTEPANTSSGTATIGLPTGGTDVTISAISALPAWDFAINNIAFNYSALGPQTPKDLQIPAIEGLIGAASVTFSVLDAFGALPTAGVSLLGTLSEFLGGAGVSLSIKDFRDPFDPNYAQEYSPTFYTLPTVEPDQVLSETVASDANTAFRAGSQAISYLQAVYVTLNRLSSATQVKDSASESLQSTALDYYLSLTGGSLADYASGLDTVAGDLTKSGINYSVTSQEVAAFISNLQQAGFSALPQQEQSLFNEFGFDPADDQAVVTALTDVEQSNVPLTLVGALQAEAAAIGSLASIYSGNPPCFAAGTLIATSEGVLAVEDLRPGRVVTLADGSPAPIRWIGRRQVRDADVVRFLPRSLGADVPLRDLVTSLDHGMIVDGAIVPANLLVNGRGIRRETRAIVTFFHIELDKHGVLLAEGALAESYLDTGNRSNFANCPLAYDPVNAASQNPCLEVIFGGPRLDRVRAMLEGAGLVNSRARDEIAATVG